MRLQITLYNQLSKFNIYLIAVLFVIVFFGIQGRLTKEAFLLSLLIYSIIDLFPALYLHTQYYNENTNTIYDLSNRGIVERKNGKEIFYDNQNIEKIKLYIAPNLYENFFLRYFSMENYCFAEIFMKDGKKIILTSLLTTKLEKAIKVLEVPYERKKRFFCRLN